MGLQELRDARDRAVEESVREELKGNAQKKAQQVLWVEFEAAWNEYMRIFGAWGIELASW